MAKFKRANSKTVLKVLERFIADVRIDETQSYIVDAVNDMLDNLRSDDFFGTEGQCDPRGDPRD